MKRINKTARAKPTSGSANLAKKTTLEKGQIWQMGETYLQITETGKRFLHYKLTKRLQQRGLRKHMASVLTVQAFLKSNRAELLAKS